MFLSAEVDFVIFDNDIMTITSAVDLEPKRPIRLRQRLEYKKIPLLLPPSVSIDNR